MILYFGVIPMMPIAEAGAGLFTSLFLSYYFHFNFWRKNKNNQIASFIIGLTGVFNIRNSNFKSNYLPYTAFIAGATCAMGTIITNKYCKDESPLSLLLMFLSSIGVVGLLISIFFTVNPVNSVHFDNLRLLFLWACNKQMLFTGM